MKGLLVIFLLSFNVFLQAQKKTVSNLSVTKAPVALIKITFNNLTDSTICNVIDVFDNKKILFTGFAKNNTIIINGSIIGATLAAVNFPTLNKEFVLFLDLNQQYEVTGSIASPIVSKSIRHKEYEAYVAKFTPLFTALQNLNAAYTANPTKKDSLIELFNVVNDKIQAGIDNFLTENKNSSVSAFLLLQTYTLAAPDMLKTRFETLGKAATLSAFGAKVASMFMAASAGKIGTQQPDFTANDVAGNPIKLSSFRGKYVLLDFWASWCRPCRMENPSVVAAFNKFKNKNFTILSVSLDNPDQKQAWIDAIATDGLTWPNVSDLQGWGSPIAQLYSVRGIPANFLIDPKGNLLESNLRGPALEAALAKYIKPAKKKTIKKRVK